jgi:TRAP-type C4-dicarboxylate transport system substrate-binding protein
MQRRAVGMGLAAVAVGAGALGPTRAWAQEEGVTIRAVGSGDLHGGTAAAVDRLARGLAEVSHGRVRLALEPDAPDTAAVIGRLRDGEATLGWVRLAEIADLAPTVAALSVPFLFRDPQRAEALLEGTALGPLLNDQLRKQGLEPLGFLNAGTLRLAGEPPLALTGLEGKRVTARPGGLRKVAFEALGLELVPGVPAAGQPLPTPLVELRSDDLAGAGGGGSAPLAVAETAHARDLVLVCANRQRFEALAPDVRSMLGSHVQEVATWQRGGVAQLDAAALAALRQRGAQLVPLAEDQLGQAHRRVKEAVARALEGAEPSIVRTVLAYAD